MSNVYFIRAGDENVFKIGITNRSPAKRLAMLQTGNHLPLSIYAFMTTTEPRKVEARLHNRYSDRRMAGEWFNLTPQEVDEILQCENDGADMPFVEVMKLNERGKECQHYLYERETGILYSDIQNWNNIFGGIYLWALVAAVKFYRDERAYVNYDDVVDLASSDEEAMTDLLDYKERLIAAAVKLQTSAKQTVSL